MISQMLLNGQFDVGPHAKARAQENKLNLYYCVKALASTTEPERSFGPGGECFIYTKKLKSGKSLRMVVGRHRFDEKKLFVITMFLADPNVTKTYSKFGGEVCYEFG